jgi:oligoribonuclease (3'-5' exoribonuclease)
LKVQFQTFQIELSKFKYSIMQGPELVIHHSDAVLKNMNEWSTRVHKKTGLTEKCRESQVSLKDAEDQVNNPASPSHPVGKI